MDGARLPVVILCVVLAALGGGGLWWAVRAEPEPRPDQSSRAAPVHVEPALALLRAWDERRATAYAAGDPAALRALYTRDSTAGRRDVRLLRGYTDRGLRVVGLTVQLLRVQVRRDDERVVLAVTDRVSAAVARGRGTRIALPASAPRSRVVTLVRRDETWVVAAVRPGEPG